VAERTRGQVREKLGIRSFENVLAAILDPRLGFQGKIVFQGISFTPFVWFAFLNWLVIPAAIYVGCRWFDFLWKNPN
jgi:hypothetical protein